MTRWRGVLHRLPLARGMDLGARRPVGGAVGGLALVALFVPVLFLCGGGKGPLGPSIPLIFLIPVLLAATIGGRRPGVVVALAAVGAWNWFFIPPLYTAAIASPRDVVALALFLAVALLVGQLSTAVRHRADEAVQRARGAEALYHLSMTLIGPAERDDALVALTDRLRETFDLAACAVLLPTEQGGWRVVATAGTLPPEAQADRNQGIAATATWAASNRRTVTLGHLRRTRGAHAEIFPKGRRGGNTRFVPLQVGERPLGVLQLIEQAQAPPDERRDRLLATFVNGAALALERERLAAEERAAAVAREGDRLKGAVLSSLSHDLRTPLAGIKAAASSLLQPDVVWTADERQAFIVDIDSEADRLTRVVSNLLDLSRLQAGAATPARDWEDVGELISRVMQRLSPSLGDHVMTRVAPASLPAVRLDAVQIEQALTNLLENAAKYAPPGTPIVVGADLTVVDATALHATLRVWVSDHGPGIPVAERARIFEPFHRGGQRDSVAGTGLGLAIVKGLVEAHGGDVALTSTSRGSTFTITLPVEVASAADVRLPESPAPTGTSR